MSRAKSEKSVSVTSPYRVWRKRGQSFGNCLLMIVIVFGLALFGWQKFGKTRVLIMAGKQVLPLKEYNQAADLEYRRHFREHNAYNAQNARVSMTKFYTDVTKGKYKDKASDFEQRYYESLQLLLDYISELDMNMVPGPFMAHHIKMSSSYRPFYEMLEALKVGYSAEGQDQKNAYIDAQKKLTEGLRLSNEGERGIKAVIGMQ